MSNRRLAPILLPLLLLLSAPANAGGLFYLFGKLGNTSLSTQFGDRFTQAVDGDDNSLGLGAGVHLGDYLAFQVEYHEFGDVPGLGSPCSDAAEVCIEIIVPVDADSRALSAAVLPQLAITDRFTVFGKAGIVAWESDVTTTFSNLGGKIDDFSDEDLLYGVGVRFQLPGPFDVFAEYERVADIADTLAVGVTLGY